jgi:LysM repeat protein
MSLLSKLAFFGFILFSLPILVAHATDFASVDSIGMRQVGDKKFILHQVNDQETLFSISRRYKVPMGDIQGANEALKQGLIVGETILVPHGQASASSTSAALAPAASPVATAPVVDAPVVLATAPVVSVPVVASTPVTSASSSPATTTPVVATTAASSPTTRTSTITHKVKAGESLYVVSKKYNVSVKDLKAWNSLRSDKVTVGQSIKIQRTVAVTNAETTSTAPTASATSPAKKEEVKKEEPTKQEVLPEKKEAAVSTTATTSGTQPGEWIAHTVTSGESLFVLAKQYGTSIEELIQWNALSSNNLKVGQSIKVGRASASATAVPTVGEAKTTPATTTATSTPASSSRSETSAASTSSSSTTAATSPLAATTGTETTTAPNTSGGFSNNKESGLAELIPDTAANKKYLVLHRTAPVGSVIRVKNEENDLTIFARVVGVLPETGDNSKVLIKLSQAAYDQLKAVNPRFPVEILY